MKKHPHNRGKGWYNDIPQHILASKGIPTKMKSKGKRKKNNEFEVTPSEGIWFHQTSPSAVDNIVDDGFVITSGGNQRYGVGVYLMDSPEGSYGEETLQVDIDGDFIDLSDDRLGRKWMELKGSVDWSNYEDLTEKLKEKYPGADGVELNNVMVVWNLDAIKDIEVKK